MSAEKPCVSCGHCPTCGHTPAKPVQYIWPYPPYIYTIPYVQPIWTTTTSGIRSAPDLGGLTSSSGTITYTLGSAS